MSNEGNATTPIAKYVVVVVIIAMGMLGLYYDINWSGFVLGVGLLCALNLM